MARHLKLRESDANTIDRAPVNILSSISCAQTGRGVEVHAFRGLA
jgi:hypothetical protein